LTKTSDPARYVDVIFVTRGDGNVHAVDPRVDPRQQYTYWVVGYTRNVGETKPSPIATVTTADPPVSNADLQVAAVSAPSMLTMPGPLATISPMLGSTVTLTWTPKVDIYLYKISYRLVGDITGIGQVATTLEVTFNQYQRTPTATVNVPQGKTVHLCVDVYYTTVYAPDHPNCKSVSAP
jgi:hypothetical protein